MRERERKRKRESREGVVEDVTVSVTNTIEVFQKKYAGEGIGGI